MNTIEVNVNDYSNPIGDLIPVVLKHYPIGASISNEKYDGYSELIKRIEHKIGLVIEKKLPAPCNLLMRELKESFADFSVISEFEKQFPNYSLSIELLNKELPEIDFIYKLKLRISLLTKHFTVFHEETSFHKNASSKISRYEPVKISIISSSSAVADVNNKYFTSLINIVNKCFPDYTFVNHNLLFTKRIKNGTPYGLDGFSVDYEYPIYAFLFDNEYNVMKCTYVTY